MPAHAHAGHRTTKTRWPSSTAGAMRVVVPHSMHGGGGGWNGAGMTNGSLIFKRERVQAQPATPGTEPQSVMSATVRAASTPLGRAQFSAGAGFAIVLGVTIMATRRRWEPYGHDLQLLCCERQADPRHGCHQWHWLGGGGSARRPRRESSPSSAAARAGRRLPSARIRAARYLSSAP